MRKIFYICNYNDQTNESNESNKRYCALSAVNKVDYICDCLNKDKYSVEIISPSWTEGKRFIKGRKYQYNNKIIKEFPSFGTRSIITKAIDFFLIKFLFSIYILKTVKRDDIMICYHSLGYSWILLFLKRIVGFKLIMEVEEIYGDVMNSSKIREKEMNYLKKTDAYIFSTELLEKLINIEDKPNVVIYGTYKIEKKRTIRLGGDSDKINIVYAGTFDPRKGGAAAAVAAAAYLGDRYRLHILGFGSEVEKRSLLKQIELIKCSKNCAEIIYVGSLTGEKYIEYIQNCRIGLATQTNDCRFNDTSFPSKILSYLANGLEVVSTRIKVVECSKVGKYVHFYDCQTPDCIAEAVKKIEANKLNDNEQVIDTLNKQFCIDINRMINSLC